MKKPDKIKTPLPGLIYPGKWFVEENPSGAHVSMTDKIMRSPYGNNDIDLAIRTHEYSHLCYSPKAKPKKVKDLLEMNCVEALEDYRVNLLAIRKGIDMEGYYLFGDLNFKKILESKNRMVIGVVGATMLRQYSIANNYLDSIPNDIATLIDSLHRNINKKIHTFLIVKKCARILADYLRPLPEIRQKGDPNKDKLPSNGGSGLLGDACKDSGNMEMQDLTDNRHRTRTVLTKKFTDRGFIFCRPDRVYSDGLCFSVRKKDPKIGTILIDYSGSMALTRKQIEDTVKKYNGPEIAIYHGRYSEGYLQVISKNGKIASKFPDSYGGNIVDYPALEWLRRQPGKKIWVSDGSVTGKGDNPYPSIELAVKKILHETDIKQIKHLKDLDSVLLK